MRTRGRSRARRSRRLARTSQDPPPQRQQLGRCSGRARRSPEPPSNTRCVTRRRPAKRPSARAGRPLLQAGTTHCVAYPPRPADRGSHPGESDTRVTFPPPGSGSRSDRRHAPRLLAEEATEIMRRIAGAAQLPVDQSSSRVQRPERSVPDCETVLPAHVTVDHGPDGSSASSASRLHAELDVVLEEPRQLEHHGLERTDDAVKLMQTAPARASAQPRSRRPSRPDQRRVQLPSVRRPWTRAQQGVPGHRHAGPRGSRARAQILEVRPPPAPVSCATTTGRQSTERATRVSGTESSKHARFPRERAVIGAELEDVAPLPLRAYNEHRVPAQQ